MVSEMTFTVEQIAQIVNSSKCRCGDMKESGRPFCFGCWKELSAPVQNHLYLPMGKGFEGWFAKANGELNRQGIAFIYKLD